MSAEKLNELRLAIDAADRDLVDAFVRRMEVAAGIAEAKRDMGKAVFDPAREVIKLDSVAALVPRSEIEGEMGGTIPVRCIRC